MKSIHSILALLALAVSQSVLAGANLDARIQAIDGGTVTLEAVDVPAWVRPDMTVKALGWDAQVSRIEGSLVALSMDAGKLKRAKVGHLVSIREPEDEQPKVCGN